MCNEFNAATVQKIHIGIVHAEHLRGGVVREGNSSEDLQPPSAVQVLFETPQAPSLLANTR